jgi:hypothetical protein
MRQPIAPLKHTQNKDINMARTFPVRERDKIALAPFQVSHIQLSKNHETCPVRKIWALSSPKTSPKLLQIIHVVYR